MRTPSSLDRATDQILDGAVETADLVADALVDVAQNAAEAVAESGEAIVALSAGRISRLFNPKTLFVLFLVAAAGATFYKWYSGRDDAASDMNESTEDVPSQRR